MAQSSGAAGPSRSAGRDHGGIDVELAHEAPGLGQDLALQRDGEAEAALDSARAKLLAVRNRRVWPARDEKILTSWNGLAIAGLASAARALDRDDYVQSAARAVEFLRRHCWFDGRLLAVHKDGRSRFAAYLDDHAFLAWGLLELLQARWHGPWLAWAIELAEALLRHFEDREAGGFFFTADDHETLILRPKTFGDDATPAGNGVAARLLLRLGFLLAEPRYLDAAERTLRAGWSLLERYPHAHASLLMALDELTEPPTIVVLRGADDDLAVWRAELDKLYDPRRMTIAIPARRGRPAGCPRRQTCWREHDRLHLPRHDVLGTARHARRARSGAEALTRLLER